MGGQRRARLRPCLGPRGPALRVPPVFLGLAACDRLLDVLQGELQLVGIELLGAAAEAGAPQLLQQMAQLPVLLDRPVALGDDGVALGQGAADQGA